MFPREMLFHEKRIHGQLRIDTEGYEGHLCDLFHDYGVVDGLVGVLAP